MKAIKITSSVILSACVAGLGLWFLPGFWFRQAGVLDLAIVVDCEGRTNDDLVSAVSLSSRMLRHVYPSDRLGVYVVDGRIHELFRGSFSEPVRIPLVNQIGSLIPSQHGRSENSLALAEVNSTLDGFLQDKSSQKGHRRVVVLFSDCATYRGEGRLFSLVGNTSVLVVGFRGDKRDAITMALMGDGSNDVHVVGPAEGVIAVDGLLDAIRDQTHPLKPAPVMLWVGVSVLFAWVVVFGLSTLVSSEPRSIRVRLTCPNDPETTQDFTLAADGASIVVGGGDLLQDYAVPVDATCAISREGDHLALCPVTGRISVRREGDEFEVLERCRLKTGDYLILEHVLINFQRIS